METGLLLLAFFGGGLYTAALAPAAALAKRTAPDFTAPGFTISFSHGCQALKLEE
jgi:hypothetical protein